MINGQPKGAVTRSRQSAETPRKCTCWCPY